MVGPLEELIEDVLVWKLYRDGCWGAGHHSQTPFLTKGFPSHVSGRLVERVAASLVERGILYRRASGHECQWSLNPAKKEEIEVIVERRKRRLGIHLEELAGSVPELDVKRLLAEHEEEVRREARRWRLSSS